MYIHTYVYKFCKIRIFFKLYLGKILNYSFHIVWNKNYIKKIFIFSFVYSYISVDFIESVIKSHQQKSERPEQSRNDKMIYPTQKRPLINTLAHTLSRIYTYTCSYCVIFSSVLFVFKKRRVVVRFQKLTALNRYRVVVEARRHADIYSSASMSNFF